MSHGDIYKATCKVNGKNYIGQANKFQGKLSDKWGYIKRWKSHVYEALHSKSDHCSLLNNAIRKYGPENFIIERIDEADDQDELDELETKYIEEYNSLVPNGYNLDTGGKKGYKVTNETKNKQSKVRLGMRKNKASRKYPEDNNLPKYIIAVRRNGIKKGFKILNFPIGVDKPEYINKYFNFTDFINENQCLDYANDYLENLKIKYNFVSKNSVENEDEVKPVPQKKNEKKKHELPPYIFPMHSKDSRRLLLGYYVEGPDYPFQVFTGKTNRWNLNAAKKYILLIDIKKCDENFEIPPLPDDLPKTRLRKNVNDNKLPKYMFSYKDYSNKNTNKIIGFYLKIDKLIINDKPYSKKFTIPTQTLEQKYDDCIEELRKQLTTHNITD